MPPETRATGQQQDTPGHAEQRAETTDRGGNGQQAGSLFLGSGRRGNIRTHDC
jgi:hypothetical protein